MFFVRSGGFDVDNYEVKVGYYSLVFFKVSLYVFLMEHSGNPFFVVVYPFV